MSRDTISRFYAAFAQLGSAAMQACYAAGLITRHTDRFDFWRWSRQALGAPGLLLGWSPFLRAKVRGQAAASLRRFLAKG